MTMTAGDDALPGTLSKGARITGDARGALSEQVRARYEAGQSIRHLATDLGRSYGFVHRLLRDAEVPLRSRGGDRTRPRAQSS